MVNKHSTNIVIHTHIHITTQHRTNILINTHIHITTQHSTNILIHTHIHITTTQHKHSNTHAHTHYNTTSNNKWRVKIIKLTGYTLLQSCLWKERQTKVVCVHQHIFRLFVNFSSLFWPKILKRTCYWRWLQIVFSHTSGI